MIPPPTAPLTSYKLNLFAVTEEIIDLEILEKEEFLTKSAQLLLKALWLNWDENHWPHTVFDAKFIKHLATKHSHTTVFYKALLHQSDPFLLKAIRIEVQAVLQRLLQTLRTSPPQTDHDKLKVHLTIHNILSLFVMFCPSPLETLTVPQYIDEQWQAIKFQINPIELTPNHGIWPHFINDQDRLFSYGFTPTHPAEAASILVHCGTGWPTAQGSALQLLADIWPYKTPGEVFFEWQHEAINHWLDQQNGKVVVAGLSLGGALAMLTAMHRPDKVQEALCLVPPGLDPFTKYDEHHSLFGAWERCPAAERPSVIIQKQSFDPVSKCGVFKESFQLIKAELAEEGRNWHIAFKLFSAHARHIVACDNTLLTIADIREENASRHRHANNYWLYHKARIAIFYGLLIPHFFLLKPMVRFINNNALAVTLSLTATCISYLLPTLTASLISLLGLTPVLSASWIIAATIIALSFSIQYAVAQVTTFYTPAPEHMLQLPQKGNAYESTSPASIHTNEYFKLTEKLSNHAPVSIGDKVNAACGLLLFYTIAFPLKFLFIDVPTFIKNLWNSPAEQQPDLFTLTEEVKVVKENALTSPGTNRCHFFACVPGLASRINQSSSVNMPPPTSTFSAL